LVQVYNLYVFDSQRAGVVAASVPLAGIDGHGGSHGSPGVDIELLQATQSPIAEPDIVDLKRHCVTITFFD
jgi:hypothetical protein